MIFFIVVFIFSSVALCLYDYDQIEQIINWVNKAIIALILFSVFIL